MNNWVIKGLRTGIVTTRYPAAEEHARGISPGIPQGGYCPDRTADILAKRCPTGALSRTEGLLAVDRARCVHCFRCTRGVAIPADWDQGFEWASLEADAKVVGQSLRRSLHIRVVDAGSCGTCLNEVKLLNNPYYNMHRLGFFITPTPRQADILLVAGPVTDHMKVSLLKTYEAMPSPKKVIAVGACALSGGIFGPSFVSGTGAADILPVDIKIPGCPPPPLSILHGLLVVTGRRLPVPLVQPVGTGGEKEGM